MRRWSAASIAASSRRTRIRESPVPTGPSEALIRAILEFKSRNPRFGGPRIARIITLMFGVDIDRNVVGCVLAQTRASIPLQTVLRLLRLSPSRFNAWQPRRTACALDDQSSCPRKSPHRLTPSEIRFIHDMVTAPEYRHVPTGTLPILAQRLGRV